MSNPTPDEMRREALSLRILGDREEAETGWQTVTCLVAAECLEFAADQLEQAHVHIRELCDFIFEAQEGECGCCLLAPEELPCVICEAVAFLPAPEVKKMSMAIDADWLREKIEEEPDDAECDAGVLPLTAGDKDDGQ